MKLLTTILLFSSLLTSGQADQKLLDSLKFISDVPYICRAIDLTQIQQNPQSTFGCGDIIFWRIVQQKEKIIPQLIQKISDVTETKATVPNFGGQYSVADVAYKALEEIIKGIPTFELLGQNSTKTAAVIVHIGLIFAKTKKIDKNFRQQLAIGMLKINLI